MTTSIIEEIALNTESINTNDDFKKTLYECVGILDNFLDQIQSNKTMLEELYNDTYSFHAWTDNKEIIHEFKSDEFQNVFEQNIEYVNKQKGFINQVMELPIIKENKFGNQMKDLLDDCVNQIHLVFKNYEPENLLFSFTYSTDFWADYASVFILSKFAQYDGNVVLIGGNGSGKSSLAKTLKGNDQEHISVIPAQKTLYFSLYDKSMLESRPKELESILLENNIDRSKTEDDYEYFEYQNNQFTKLVVAMREEYMNYLMSCEEAGRIANKDESVFGVLRKIFKTVFPEIELDFKSDDNHYMNCKKNGNTYHINALSEGEKAVIYYSISVLMARKDSFIVIDEPETYLNPSLTNVLWDMLIKERQDCKFIFITHSIDFVLGRSDSKIAWIKNFQHPDLWEFEFLDDTFTLPKTMLTEVLGSQKPIAFCEGNDKSSIDYIVYRSLLADKYTVIPVGGHLNVIQYCDVLSNSNLIRRECIGVVDGDNFPIEKIVELSNKNIIVLPFNEIEMLLLSDLVMKYTMQAVRPIDAERKISDFKVKFWEKAEEKKEKMILTSTRNVVNEYIQKEKVQKYDTLENIKDSLANISKYDVDIVHNDFSKKIDKIIEEKDYDKLLQACNLKKEVSCGIANTFLDSDYEEKAIQQIMSNEELQTKLLDKYFNAVTQ